jgi:hypothetical protein
MEQFWTWLAASVLGSIATAVLTPFLKGYSKTKGENLATHEDIAALVEQTRALAQATKEIEAKIDDQVWNRQRRWELKREVLFEASKRLANADDALISLKTVCELIASSGESFADGKQERLLKWEKTVSSLSESRFVVGVVCGKQTVDAIDGFAGLAGQIAASLSQGNSNAYQEKALELAKKYYIAIAAMRKELEVDLSATSQSSESLATPSPD